MTIAIRKSKASRARLIGATALIILATISGLGVALWWEDRPLRTIERALERRDFEHALAQVNQYLESFPTRSKALSQKARALAGLERWSEATRLFDRIGADSIAARRAWSLALVHEERWTEALPLLARLSEQFPDDSDVLFELASCEGNLGYFEEAIAATERLALMKGQKSRGNLLLGMLQSIRGNNRLALQAWEPILERDPDLTGLQVSPAEFLLMYGRALTNEGRPAEARRHLSRALALSPGTDVQDALAEACEDLGDIPAAVALWRQVVAASPDDRTAREGLARMALDSQSSEEALRWLEPLLGRPDLQASTAYLAQRAATLAGDGDSAAKWDCRAAILRESEKRMKSFDLAIRNTPHSFWGRALRAHRFAREGNTRQALALAEELLKKDRAQPFVRQLVEALRNHEPLPSLDRVPLELVQHTE